MTPAEGAVVVASLSVVASSVAAFSSRKTRKKVEVSTDQVVENNGWAKTNAKTMEAMLAEFHEFRGEFRQWRKDHEEHHASKKRPRG